MSKLSELLLYTKDLNLFSVKDIENKGFSKSTLKQAVDQGYLYKLARGVYSSKDDVLDEYLEIQMNSKYIIFSNETALYLHNLTEVLLPKYAVTVPTGYKFVNRNNLKKYYNKKEIYELGIEELVCPYGNKISVYNIDKTICDIVKNESRINQQIFVQALQNYGTSNLKNVNRAVQYARIMKVEKKLQSYLKIATEG